MVTIIKGAQVSPSGVPGPSTIAREAVGGGGGGTLPLGTSILYVVDGAPPDGWLDADGSEVSRTDYADYYALVGDLYGEGDGSTTFNLPNAIGRVAIGIGASRILGEIGGEETHILSIAEMPTHTHIQNTHTHIQNAHSHESYLEGQGAVSCWAFGYSAAGALVGQNWVQPITATNQNTVATNQNTGGGLAHNNMQPYITWRYIVKVLLDGSGSDIPIADEAFDGLLRKVSGLTTDFIDGTNNSRDLASAIAELGISGGGGGASLPVGSVLSYIASDLPDDTFMVMDGSEIDRATYPELFALIGELYGSGDGSTTFNIPDARDRFIVGEGTVRSIAETGGEETHVLSIAEMPAHTHSATQPAHGHSILENPHQHGAFGFYNVLSTTSANINVWSPNWEGPDLCGATNLVHTYISTYNAQPAITVANTGGGLAHNNMPPYIVLRYILKVSPDPVSDSGGEGSGGSVVGGGNPIGTIIQFAGIGDVPNYLETDGSEVDRVIYSELFAVIGETYGPGDGSTTFNLPDCGGRVSIGANAIYSLGDIGGEESHVLTISEMPPHTHIQDAHTHIQNAHNHTIPQYEAVFPTGTSPWSAYIGSTAMGNVVGSTTATNQTTIATNQNTGGGLAHNNLQPYIAFRYLIKASGSEGGSGEAGVGESLPIGSSILYTAVGNPPNGWMVCDGAEVSRSGYSEYFDLVGELYGVGDGSTTFNLPNTIGRFIVAGGSSRSIGDIGGEETHILTIAEMPSHTHVQNSHTHDVGAMQGTAAGGGYAVGMGGTGGLGWTIPGSIAINQNTGGGLAHNNLPPYMVWNYIVKVKTVGSVPADAPVADETVDGLLRKVSGLDTDFVDGTNNCQDLATAVSALGIGGGGGVSYSTDEQDTGLTWIDGKVIYQKTINFGTLPDNGYKEVAHNIVGFEQYIDIRGVIKMGSYFYTIPPASTVLSNQIDLYLDGWSIYVTTSTAWNAATAFFTLQYTKTA